jgi:hypothetical protein
MNPLSNARRCDPNTALSHQTFHITPLGSRSTSRLRATTPPDDVSTGAQRAATVEPAEPSAAYQKEC